MTNPVLFLDFDGVLNHWNTKTRYPKDGMMTGLDPACVARLNAICEAVPDARIVISSTWRLFFDLPTLKEALTGAGFRFADRVIDCTPDLSRAPGKMFLFRHYNHYSRGDEILSWLGGRPEKPSSIVVLDDIADMGPLADRLVLTDLYAGGLTDEHVERVSLMLLGAREVAA